MRASAKGWRRTALPFLVIGGLASVCGMLAAALGIAALLALSGTPVTVVVAGEAYNVTSDARTVGELLSKAGVTLLPDDVVEPAPESRVLPDMVITVRYAREVLLTINGSAQVIRTALEDPQEILTAQGLTLSEDDDIVIDGREAELEQLALWATPPRSIRITRAVTITIEDVQADGTMLTQTVQTSYPTVGEALFEANVAVYVSDGVTPPMSDPVQEGMTVRVDRARPLTITADGVEIQTTTHGLTVGEALAEAGVILLGLDYSIPTEDSLINPGMNVQVIRVREETLTETTELAYETVYQADAALDLDQVRVEQAGQPGLQRTITRVRYENGVETARTVEEQFAVRDPVHAVIAYGTNVVIRTLDTPEGPISYWRRLCVYATSYHPAALGGDNVTATGRLLERGIVGIDPTLIPYGTNLYVNGYGTGVAADTGAPRSSPYWVDLGYTDADYVGWHQYVYVYLLAPAPAEIDYVLPAWRGLRGAATRRAECQGN